MAAVRGTDHRERPVGERPPRPRRAPGCGSARPTRGTPRGRAASSTSVVGVRRTPSATDQVEVVLGVDLDVAHARDAGDVRQDPAGRPARRAERRGELQQAWRARPAAPPTESRRAPTPAAARWPRSRRDRVGSAEPAVEQRQRGPDDQGDDDCARHDVHPAAHACFNRRCRWLLPRCGSRRGGRAARRAVTSSRPTRPGERDQPPANGGRNSTDGARLDDVRRGVGGADGPVADQRSSRRRAPRPGGCRGAARRPPRRSSASVIGPFTGTSSDVGPGGRLGGGPVADPDDVRLSHGLDPSNVTVSFLNFSDNRSPVLCLGPIPDSGRGPT